MPYRNDQTTAYDQLELAEALTAYAIQANWDRLEAWNTPRTDETELLIGQALVLEAIAEQLQNFHSRFRKAHHESPLTMSELFEPTG